MEQVAGQRRCVLELGTESVGEREAGVLICRHLWIKGKPPAAMALIQCTRSDKVSRVLTANPQREPYKLQALVAYGTGRSCRGFPAAGTGQGGR